MSSFLILRKLLYLIQGERPERLERLERLERRERSAPKRSKTFLAERNVPNVPIVPIVPIVPARSKKAPAGKNRRRLSGVLGQIRTAGPSLRSLACPMPYGTDIIYGDSSFVIYFEVQGFCGAICTKCRVLPRFLRRPISKLLAGIALPTTSFITLYHIVVK